MKDRVSSHLGTWSIIYLNQESSDKCCRSARLGTSLPLPSDVMDQYTHEATREGISLVTPWGRSVHNARGGTHFSRIQFLFDRNRGQAGWLVFSPMASWFTPDSLETRLLPIGRLSHSARDTYPKEPWDLSGVSL